VLVDVPMRVRGVDEQLKVVDNVAEGLRDQA
jgi:hypothetical protein